MGNQKNAVTAGRTAGQLVLVWLGTLALNAAVVFLFLRGETSARAQFASEALCVAQELLFVFCASYLVARVWRARGLSGAGAWLIALLVFGAVFVWAMVTEPGLAPSALMFFAAWGGALLALAVGVIAGVQNDRGVKACPFCAETIRAQAVVCRYCAKELPPPSLAPQRPHHAQG